MRLIFVIVLFTVGLCGGKAQSCCSGGVPTSSNLGLSNIDEGQLIMSLGADLNLLNTLKSGSEKLDDDLRNRTTQSYLIRAGYRPLNNLSIEVLVPYVIQTRRIVTNNGSLDKQRTDGVGDVSLLAIYELLKGDMSWKTGVGASIPTGDFGQRDERGLFLLEDLQPGSGALDMILFNSLEYNLSKNNPNRIISVRGIYSLSGVNENSRNGSQSYQFGDDLQVLFTYSDQLLIGSELISPSVGGRYRSVQRDKVDGFPNSGSGGEFLFLRGGFNWNIGTQSSLYIGGELPLFSKVNETQLAPSISFNFGWVETINLKSTNQPLINF